MASSPQTQTASIARIIAIIEGIEKKVEPIDQIKIDVAVMMNRFDELCKDVYGLKETINGNGKAGLKDDVSHLNSRMKVIVWAAGVVGSALIVFNVSLWVYLIIKYGAQVIR